MYHVSEDAPMYSVIGWIEAVDKDGKLDRNRIHL